MILYPNLNTHYLKLSILRLCFEYLQIVPTKMVKVQEWYCFKDHINLVGFFILIILVLKGFLFLDLELMGKSRGTCIFVTNESKKSNNWFLHFSKTIKIVEVTHQPTL